MGPFAARAQAAVAAVETVLDAVPVRACTQRIAAHGARASPCALHELGRCAAPCAGLQTPAEYAPAVVAVADLFAGRADDALRAAAHHDRRPRRPRAVRDGGAPARSARRGSCSHWVGRSGWRRSRPSTEIVGARPGRARRLGGRGGALRPPRRRRGRRARGAADAGDRRAARGRAGGAARARAAARRARRGGRARCTAGSPPAAPGSCTPSRRGPSPPAAPRRGRGGRSAPGRSWWTPERPRPPPRPRAAPDYARPAPAAEWRAARRWRTWPRVAAVITAIVLVHTAADRIPETAQAIADLDGVSRGLLLRGRRRPRRHRARRRPRGAGRGHRRAASSKVAGVQHTDTHIAFRSYAKVDTDATFSVGLT